MSLQATNMVLTIEAALVHDFLKAGPKVSLTNQPLFKLVWSNDERELRLGTFRDYDSNNIFIREYTKVENCLKYSWIKNTWIIEQWVPPPLSYTPELPNSISGAYEILYAFCDINYNPLPILLRVAQIVVQRALEPKTSEMLKKTAYKNKVEEKDKINDKKDWDLLSDEGPLVSQFHDGSAILLPGKDF